MSDAVENVLAHYGKKGMRWGVRNSESSSSAQKSAVARRKGSTEPILSTDAKKAANAKAKAKAKGTKALTNNELKILNERIRLEKQLKDLDPNTTAKGKKFVGKHANQIISMTVGAAASKYVITKLFPK